MTWPRREVLLAVADAQDAAFEYDHARAWLAEVGSGFAEPLAVEVWVFDRELCDVLLVRHRWRGWVPPGGAVEPDEAPQQAALRELAEETSLEVVLLSAPAAVAVRSYHADWSETLGISYAAIVDRAVAVEGEADQTLAWHRLSEPWDSSFPEDRSRMNAYVEWFRREFGPGRRR